MSRRRFRFPMLDVILSVMACSLIGASFAMPFGVLIAFIAWLFGRADPLVVVGATELFAASMGAAAGVWNSATGGIRERDWP